ncbi:MAG TPA: secretin N-terminal domain-containing protein [Pyrinomonadaceae bacterium]|nr:secretin N-terminal domain-containing protein [Pyrinomonadaceae bacterium]
MPLEPVRKKDRFISMALLLLFPTTRILVNLMKSYFRYKVFSMIVLLSLLTPTAALALGDGKKYFREGMKYEAAEEWDKAAEQFAMAVSENPRNPEYRLHLQRALFNASQMFMRKGRAAAEAKDYQNAYIAYRKAFSFDPVNQLAKSEMERMLRLIEEEQKAKTGNVKQNTGAIVPAALPNFPKPQKLEQLRDVPFPGGVNLTYIIKQLADDLDLNVLFDTDSRLDTRTTRIELKRVTAAQALDYIFLQENLFFQKVGPRTILVASNTRRTNFQQLVLRTFYLANANPKDVKTIIQTAIPAQPGRTQTIVVEDPSTNSLTIRDTAENIALFEKLINSLDKDRAEVVMDVAIYEVSKNDLLQLGNQIGTQAELTQLGGTTRGVVGLGGNELFGTLGRAAADVIPTVFGAGIAIPSANLNAFQNKGTTRLIASTQIHAFNNEDSSARIGQRVPVRSASFITAANTSNNGVVSDVINYEEVGLTLKFKPIVFPNQDVQVTMEIQSKDVVAGGTTTNPVFSERTIKGTARVQNNRTLLLASVAQDVESRTRSGLPLLGLIPILGRLFTAPSKDNRKVDIVIAITPRVIRAPAILPDDLVERPTGSLATPTNSSLEEMIINEEREKYIAELRRLPNQTNIQLPDRPADDAGFIPSTGSETTAQKAAETQKTGDAQSSIAANTQNAVAADAAKDSSDSIKVNDSIQLKPIDTSAKDVVLRQTALKPKQEVVPDKPVTGEANPANSKPEQANQPAEANRETNNAKRPTLSPESVGMNENADRAIKGNQDPAGSSNELRGSSATNSSATVAPDASITLPRFVASMKAGEKALIPVMIDSSKQFRSAVLGIRFDPQTVSIKTIKLGDVFGTSQSGQVITPFLNQDGKIYVSLSGQAAAESRYGILAYLEIEALSDGSPSIALEPAAVNLLSVDGKALKLQF